MRPPHEPRQQMDPDLFAADFPGTLARVPRDPVTGNQHAFVPLALPPDWEFPARLWPLLGEAKQKLGLLEGIGRTLPNPGILLRPLADREAIKSSRLEGTYVTARELLVYEMRPRESGSETDPANYQREVLNYRRALQQGADSDLPLSLRLIRELHGTLMTGVRGGDHTPGEFRTGQVAIRPDHRFVPPPPDKLLECLHTFERHLHARNPKYDPLVDCFLTHYQFESIHPFNDGNGRVGRLLLALMLKEHCGLSKPWLYMSEYFEARREEYFDALFGVSTQGRWESWIEFCLEGTVAQADDTILRCERLLRIKDDFAKRLHEAGGSVRLSRIVEDIFDSPFVRVTDLVRQLEVTYPTAKADAGRLVDVGILSELPDMTPKTYYAPEVFRVAYEALE